MRSPPRQEMLPSPLQETQQETSQRETSQPETTQPETTQPMPSHANEIPAWAGPLSTRGLDKGWRSVASRPVNLGPDQPEGWSWMAVTTVTHQPATESTDRTPISLIGGHLAERPRTGARKGEALVSARG